MAPNIYGVFENGLAYQYYPGVTLNIETVLDFKIWPLVARQMAKMHKVELSKEVSIRIYWNMWYAMLQEFINLRLWLNYDSNLISVGLDSSINPSHQSIKSVHIVPRHCWTQQNIVPIILSHDSNEWDKKVLLTFSIHHNPIPIC